MRFEDGGLDQVTSSLDFNNLFPFAAIRGQRIIRDTERSLGNLHLDSKTAQELGTSNIGVFVGGCRQSRLLIDPIRQLSTSGHPGQFIVAFSENQLADKFYHELRQDRGRKQRPDFWTNGCVTLTTPEKLRLIRNDQFEDRPVACVILIDPPCITYQARGGHESRYRFNDRPQHIARFRARHSIAGWQPPFFLLTESPAISRNTALMLGPYSLEAWWFVEGITMRMGLPPVIPLPESPYETPNLSPEWGS